MKLTRRQFAILTAAVAARYVPRVWADSTTTPSSEPAQPSSVVDTGPLAEFKADDVYDDFRDQGVLVIRREETLFALSSICTHKGCKVRVASDQSFYCKCHGSTFDKNGRVTKGPATRDLPRLAVALDANKHVLVDRDQPIVHSSIKIQSNLRDA